MSDEARPSTADYYSLIVSAVSKLDNNTREARRALYERAHDVLIAPLRRRDPPAGEAEIAREQRALAAAIHKVEDEVSQELDFWARTDMITQSHHVRLPLVKSKAEAILDVQRKRALHFSIPKKLVAVVRQRSTLLYYFELRDYFRSKYIEEIEKSDVLLPASKAAMKDREALCMGGDFYGPHLHEVAGEMSTELLHPDAFGQIVTQRHAAKQARRVGRIERIRKFFFSDLPGVVRLCAQASPYLIVLIATHLIAHHFERQLSHFDTATYHLAYGGVILLSCLTITVGVGFYYMRDDSSFDEPEPTTQSGYSAWCERRERAIEEQSAKNKPRANIAFTLTVVLLMISGYMHGG